MVSMTTLGRHNRLRPNITEHSVIEPSQCCALAVASSHTLLQKFDLKKKFVSD